MRSEHTTHFEMLPQYQSCSSSGLTLGRGGTGWAAPTGRSIKLLVVTYVSPTPALEGREGGEEGGGRREEGGGRREEGGREEGGGRREGGGREEGRGKEGEGRREERRKDGGGRRVRQKGEEGGRGRRGRRELSDLQCWLIPTACLPLLSVECACCPTEADYIHANTKQREDHNGSSHDNRTQCWHLNLASFPGLLQLSCIRDL